ncbi:hypothetical protein AMS68_005169 [Peltaster fructicola]|uniref:Zn(2)-C6 fungal-type domain-containing protein n=1 Tax=Peltaster fructicola TaxID=286661 RepID=A0A6H0XY06_9PEZI|nr:hypothetical protein AMS68_005169 [Peltaster fructicola]
MVTPKREARVTKPRKVHASRKSCDTCHKSKTKCDRQRPVCSTCKIFARQCTYLHNAVALLPHLETFTSGSSSEREERIQHDPQSQQSSLTGSSASGSNTTPSLSFSPTELDLNHYTLLTDGVSETSARRYEESSMILAAIRMGMPVDDIRQVLMDTNYATYGLAYLLENRRVSSEASSPESLQHRSKLPTFNSHAWETLRYEPEIKAQHNQREMFVVASLRAIEEVADRGNPSVQIPTWALLPPQISTQVTDPFDEAFRTMKAEIVGVDVEKYCGAHAHLDALLHGNSPRRVPRLSQILAALLASLLPLEDSGSTGVTSLAVMWLHWSLFSWLLSPTREHFERMPKMIRPTPWQLFSPHVLIYDFIAVPALRDYMCREPPEHNTWLTEACKTTQFAWKKTALHALTRHPVSKAIDLCAECKEEAGKAENWSFGPSVRPHLPNVDRYIRVRTSGYNGSG